MKLDRYLPISHIKNDPWIKLLIRLFLCNVRTFSHGRLDKSKPRIYAFLYVVVYSCI